MKKLFICFSAGCLGALANSIALWLCGHYGINQMLKVAIAPGLSPAWLYPRIVWGGIWGLLFLLPILKSRPMAKGTFLSLGPTVVQLFVVFPYKAHKGLAGLDLGMLTPLLVLLFNWIWGLVTAAGIQSARRG